MKQKLFSVFSCLVMIIALTGATSNKVTASPLSDVTTDSGTGCYVPDGNDGYAFDSSCSWHVVIKRDKDANITEYRYQDHGTMPEGAPRPSRTISETYPLVLNPLGLGLATEITTPSGEYKSSFVFKN